MSRHFRRLGALSTVVVGSLLLTLGLTAAPAFAIDYPTWDDVLDARESQAQTEAQIAEIEGILGTLQTQSDQLAQVAQTASEQYNAAALAYDTAAARADKLEGQADAAATRAADSRSRAGALIAQLARSGGGSITLELLMSDNADDLLSGLGTASKLTEQSALILARAQQDENRARSLSEQARIAQDARDALADAAKVALDAAKAASEDALARLAEQQTASNQLYAQLASLKGTTADVEQRYQEGVTAEQEAQQQPEPTPPAPTPPNPPPPAPNGSAVQAAIAFATAQVGDRYQFAGSGPDAWDCSGLTKAAYAAAGVYIGAHLVSSQYYTMSNQGRLVPLGDMVPGDLIFYANGGSPGGGFYHVAMYVGSGQMVEAPREGVPVRITAVRYWDALPYAGRPTP